MSVLGKICFWLFAEVSLSCGSGYGQHIGPRELRFNEGNDFQNQEGSLKQ